MESARRW